MVSEFSERNESGQKTFSGRKFVKPRLHYGDPIVIATHHPLSLRYALTVIAARHPRHCEQRSCEANQPRPSSLRAAKREANHAFKTNKGPS